MADISDFFESIGDTASGAFGSVGDMFDDFSFSGMASGAWEAVSDAAPAMTDVMSAFAAAGGIAGAHATGGAQGAAAFASQWSARADKATSREWAQILKDDEREYQDKRDEKKFQYDLKLLKEQHNLEKGAANRATINDLASRIKLDPTGSLRNILIAKLAGGAETWEGASDAILASQFVTEFGTENTKRLVDKDFATVGEQKTSIAQLRVPTPQGWADFSQFEKTNWLLRTQGHNDDLFSFIQSQGTRLAGLSTAINNAAGFLPSKRQDELKRLEGELNGVLSSLSDIPNNPTWSIFFADGSTSPLQAQLVGAQKIGQDLSASHAAILGTANEAVTIRTPPPKLSLGSQLFDPDISDADSDKLVAGYEDLHGEDWDKVWSFIQESGGNIDELPLILGGVQGEAAKALLTLVNTKPEVGNGSLGGFLSHIREQNMKGPLAAGELAPQELLDMVSSLASVDVGSRRAARDRARDYAEEGYKAVLSVNESVGLPYLDLGITDSESQIAVAESMDLVDGKPTLNRDKLMNHTIVQTSTLNALLSGSGAPTAEHMIQAARMRAADMPTGPLKFWINSRLTELAKLGAPAWWVKPADDLPEIRGLLGMGDLVAGADPVILSGRAEEFSASFIDSHLLEGDEGGVSISSYDQLAEYLGGARAGLPLHRQILDVAKRFPFLGMGRGGLPLSWRTDDLAWMIESTIVGRDTAARVGFPRGGGGAETILSKLRNGEEVIFARDKPRVSTNGTPPTAVSGYGTYPSRTAVVSEIQTLDGAAKKLQRMLVQEGRDPGQFYDADPGDAVHPMIMDNVQITQALGKITEKSDLLKARLLAIDSSSVVHKTPKQAMSALFSAIESGGVDMNKAITDAAGDFNGMEFATGSGQKWKISDPHEGLSSRSKLHNFFNAVGDGRGDVSHPIEVGGATGIAIAKETKILVDAKWKVIDTLAKSDVLAELREGGLRGGSDFSNLLIEAGFDAVKDPYLRAIIVLQAHELSAPSKKPAPSSP